MHRTEAWFIPGRQTRSWLDEILHWSVPMAPIRLCVIGDPSRRLAPAGVLVVLPHADSIAPSPHVLPYGRFGSRLYLPADSVPYPRVSPDEADAQLYGELLVLHPTLGLAGFDADDILSIADLLSPPTLADKRWDCAHPGIAPRLPLRSITVFQLPDLETMLNEARGDIGTESPDNIAPLTNNDPARGALGTAGQYAAYGGAMIVAGLAGGLAGLGKLLGSGQGYSQAGYGHHAEGPGMLEGLIEWAEGKMAALSDKMQNARDKELARLMRLMESDPDQGLKYALPLAGGGAHRGIAPPSDHLGERSTRFSLGGLRGGEAADFWDLQAEHEQRLRKSYHDAAQREVNLGRHRRAAYIYAQLLGDYHAAANVLRQGKHYRQAAAMYKDHLHNPAEAARCLEDGGLLIDAIAIYSELGRFEKIGDLYTTLDDAEAAEQAYRKALAAMRSADDLLAAATLLETKMARPDEALDVLAEAWPQSRQAEACLTARFALLGRLGKHDQTEAIVRDMPRSDDVPQHGGTLITVLASLTRTYPDQAVRKRCIDGVQIIASRILPTTRPVEAPAITNVLADLFPNDVLLKRDATRYHSQAKKTAPSPIKYLPTRQPPPGVPGKVTLAVRLQLPLETQWMAFASAGQALYGIGYAERANGTMPLMICHDWETHYMERQWDTNCPIPKPIILSVDPTERGPTLVRIVEGPPLPLDGPSRATVNPYCRGGIPTWFPEQFLGSCYDRSGQVWVVALTPTGLTLDLYAITGALQQSQPLSPSIDMERMCMAGLHMAAQENEVWLAGDRYVIWNKRGKDSTLVELDSPITAIAPSPPYLQRRIAVTCEKGCAMLRGELDQVHVEPFGRELLNAKATYTREGFLAVASPGEGYIYDSIDGQTTPKFRFDAPDAPPVAVVRTGESRQFAVITEGGEVSIYDIPRS